jgi:hypothetical protein
VRRSRRSSGFHGALRAEQVSVKLHCPAGLTLSVPQDFRTTAACVTSQRHRRGGPLRATRLSHGHAISSPWTCNKRRRMSGIRRSCIAQDSIALRRWPRRNVQCAGAREARGLRLFRPDRLEDSHDHRGVDVAHSTVRFGPSSHRHTRALLNGWLKPSFGKRWACCLSSAGTHDEMRRRYRSPHRRRSTQSHP